MGEYEEDLKNIVSNHSFKKDYPFYHKWMYVGDVGRYSGIINGLSYFIKEFDDYIEVYNDVKFSSHICKIKYEESEWIVANNIHDSLPNVN